MGNYCSIYHNDFNKLVSLTGSHNKAVFLDKCIYWWQISKYTLGDSKIWFTRKVSDMAKELCISERTVARYLNDFEENGLLDRTCRLSSSNKNNQFTVTKKLYIRITEKLLAVLPDKTKIPYQPSTTRESSFLDQNVSIDKDIKSEFIYKEKDNNVIINNTVSEPCSVNNFQKQQQNIKPTTSSNQYSIEPLIGERITDRLKNYIKGMLCNTQKQHNLQFSDPNKLFAEIVFSVTQATQWQGVSNPHHRVNIIAKLLRTNQWKTPKGFYNHWDIGQWFRKKDHQKLTMEQQRKVEEGCRAPHFLQNEYQSSTAIGQKNTVQEKLTLSMKDLSLEIHQAERRFKEVEAGFEKGQKGFTALLLESEAIRIAQLYTKKDMLQLKIDEQDRLIS